MQRTRAEIKAMRVFEAARRLVALGAQCLRAEDRQGETKAGWWLDGVYLGPRRDPEYALRVLNGGG